MNKLALVTAVFITFISASSVSAVTYVKWGDVSDAPVRATTSASASTRVSLPTGSSTEAGADYLLEIDGVKGESKEDTKQGSSAPAEPEATVNKLDAITVKQGAAAGGKVEHEWKVEEGESAAGKDRHKNEIEILSNSNTSEAPDGDEDAILGMVILREAAAGAKGGVNVAAGDVNGFSEEVRAELARILKEGIQETGAPVEQVSLNFTKIIVKLSQDLKLFGFIPVATTADVEVDARGNAVVEHPWWSFLASGKDAELGVKVVTVLKAAIETRHDAVKNAIANIK